MAKCPYLDEFKDENSVGVYDCFCSLCKCRLKSNDLLVQHVCGDLYDEYISCPMYKEESLILKLREEKYE